LVPADGQTARATQPHPVDIFVPHDQAETSVAAALTAGGQMVDNSHAPAWWTLADPEGNEVDIATWRGRD
jgi:4a-hydroxytetrahydrobiopterin dehydratase